MISAAGREVSTPSQPPWIADNGDGTYRNPGVEVDRDGLCQFFAATPAERPRPIGPPFTAEEGRWVGATLGLFATAPHPAGTVGAADITAFHVTAPPTDHSRHHQPAR